MEENQEFNNIDSHALKLSMTIEQVWDFCTSLGMEGSYINDEKLVFETACHNPMGHGKHKLYYYENTKLFNCYTGCGGAFDIFELVQKIAEQKGVEMSLDDAILSYTDTQEFVFLSSSGENNKIKEIDKKYIKPDFKFYDKKVLYGYRKAVSLDWLKEGISYETQRKYGLLYDSLNGGIAFPHYSAFGGLLGVRERFLAEETVEKTGAKYMPVKFGEIYLSSPLSMYLFALNHNQVAMRVKKKAIIFEGEKSVMLADEYMGKYNYSTAAFGMKFSRHQFEALMELGVEEIIIAFDKQFKERNNFDNEYYNMFNLFDRISSNYEPFGVKITYMFDLDDDLEYKDSPIDKGIEIFHKMFSERKTITELLEDVDRRGQYPYIRDEDLPF